jgi:hypothetical protein
MVSKDPTFIIEHDGKYYLTRELWVYDAAQGTPEQVAGASTVAAIHGAAPKVTASVVPDEQDPADFGTAIHHTAIHATAINGDGEG